MFTGIVEGTGRIVEARGTGAGSRLLVEAPGILGEGEVGLGDSVALEGCCLTVTELGPHRAAFDVVPATLARTTLGDLRPGSRVNLERAMRLGDRIDGHLVQGHVDGVARVVRAGNSGDGWMVSLQPERPQDHLLDTMIPRGSVTIGGVSLTLARFEPPLFTVALIPTTRDLTTLGDGLRAGMRVNIEVDMIGKYVHSRLAQMGGDSEILRGLRGGD